MARSHGRANNLTPGTQGRWGCDRTARAIPEKQLTLKDRALRRRFLLSVVILIRPSRNRIKAGHNFATLTMKPIMLLMVALVVFGCANHREARRKSVQLYPGLPQHAVVSLFWNAK
jgi:hypothetical protein